LGEEMMTFRKGRYDSQDPARQAKSAFYQAGAADGCRDTALESACPPQLGLGMDADREFSYMYQAGWAAGYAPVPCRCDGSCKRKEGQQ
jgi:hypothetical protein